MDKKCVKNIVKWCQRSLVAGNPNQTQFTMKVLDKCNLETDWLSSNNPLRHKQIIRY